MALSDKGRRWPLLLSAAGLLAIGGAGLAQSSGGGFTAQVQAGHDAYAQNCAACHGSELSNGEFAPPLKGPAFLATWAVSPSPSSTSTSTRRCRRRTPVACPTILTPRFPRCC